MNQFYKVQKPCTKAVLILSSLLLGTPWLTQAQLVDPATQSEAGHQHNSNSANQVKTYTCPMHPEVESHEPGRCPKCNMFLV
ncbi:MAG: efflux transporter periplasmic adaptor subunit, partial [Shewanella xiamenensis]|nr:efflux transporter periplasmic adaptor subunit [Shewanella xiamenensis]